jgi:hypothetical protein
MGFTIGGDDARAQQRVQRAGTRRGHGRDAAGAGAAAGRHGGGSGWLEHKV